IRRCIVGKPKESLPCKTPWERIRSKHRIISGLGKERMQPALCLPWLRMRNFSAYFLTLFRCRLVDEPVTSRFTCHLEPRSDLSVEVTTRQDAELLGLASRIELDVLTHL